MRTGRPPTPTPILEARGSWRAAKRKKDAAQAKRKKPRKVEAEWKDLSAAQLKKICCSLPGYDPYAQGEGCRLDTKLANAALEFFHRDLKHIEGAVAGKPFVLERWQQAIIANLFGWVRWSEKWGRWIRRYREALIYIPRKNGKSPTIAGVGLYVLLKDQEAGQQDYLAASTREQAGKLFRYAKGMVKLLDPDSEQCRVYGGTAQAGQSKSIVKLPEETSFLQVIAADADASHGGTSHLLIVDELHTQPNRDLIDTLTTSMASENRAEPLMLYVTTADFDRESICNEKHAYACAVRDNGGDKAKPGYDPSFLPVIYEATTEEDWTDEKVWARVNPNLNVSVSLEYLRRECLKAEENPALENVFKRLHLNIKTRTDVRAIPMDKWDLCGQDADPVTWRKEQIERLKGKECFGGLDLGSRSDLTALGLLFPDGPNRYLILPYFWVPKATARLRERRDRVPYETWIRQGYMNTTEGDTTDYDKVRLDLNELANYFAIRELAVDRAFQGVQLCTQLMSDGFQVIEFGQGFYSMAAPTRCFLDLIVDGGLLHGNHPILRWMAQNASTEEKSDAADNLKFSKKKSSEKIDGIIATTMALGRAMLAVDTESVYSERGILALDSDPRPPAPTQQEPAPAQVAVAQPQVAPAQPGVFPGEAGPRVTRPTPWWVNPAHDEDED